MRPFRGSRIGRSRISAARTVILERRPHLDAVQPSLTTTRARTEVPGLEARTSQLRRSTADSSPRPPTIARPAANQSTTDEEPRWCEMRTRAATRAAAPRKTRTVCIQPGPGTFTHHVAVAATAAPPDIDHRGCRARPCALSSVTYAPAPRGSRRGGSRGRDRKTRRIERVAAVEEEAGVARPG